MKYTTLGKSTLKVSRICMGCMGFGDEMKPVLKELFGEYDESTMLIPPFYTDFGKNTRIGKGSQKPSRDVYSIVKFIEISVAAIFVKMLFLQFQKKYEDVQHLCF